MPQIQYRGGRAMKSLTECCFRIATVCQIIKHTEGTDRKERLCRNRKLLLHVRSFTTSFCDGACSLVHMFLSSHFEVGTLVFGTSSYQMLCVYNGVVINS